MDSHSELVKKRMDDLRAQKQKEEEKKRKRMEFQRMKEEALLKEALIDCEAETLLYLESLTDEKIIADFTEHMKINDYIDKICNAWINPKTRGHSTKDQYTTEFEYKLEEEKYLCKIKCIHNYVSDLLKPICEKRERVRIENERIMQEKKQDELKIMKEREEYESMIRREKYRIDVNTSIKQFSDRWHVVSHTFRNSEIQHDYKTEFLMLTKDNVWHHSKFTNRLEVCNTQMPSTFSSYYDEGLVPFLTKCPICKSPTKFNYLDTRYPSDTCSTKSSMFTEVYCDNHYFYSSTLHKHYISDVKGGIIRSNDMKRPPLEGYGRYYSCWNPSNEWYGKGTWKEWDPKDPDGKKAEARKQREHLENLEKQIEELKKKADQIRTSL